MTRAALCFMIMAAFTALSAGIIADDISFISGTVSFLDREGTSASAGFSDFLQNCYSVVSSNYTAEQKRFTDTGIGQISEQLRLLLHSGLDRAQILSKLEQIVNGFVDTSNTVIQAGTRSFGDKLADAASKAPYNCDLKTIGGKEWMHVYGKRTWYDGTGHDVDWIGWCPGYNSCAYTASAIFYGAGKGLGMYSSVCSLFSAVRGTTIKDYSDLKPGDVIWWGTASYGDRHIGIYIGGGTAVSNYWKSGKPMRHSAKKSPGFMGFGGKEFWKAKRPSY